MNRTFKIKNLELKNRLMVPPMVCFTWPTEKGYVTEKNLKHYEDFAKGGFSLIVVEATAVTERSKLHESELGLFEDGQIEGFREIAKRIHENGAKCFVQLLHAGINGIDKNADAPSDGEFRHGITGHEMTRERIKETTEDFVKAAIRAKKAGFDGVELHGCHGYLFSQFMNSRINKRTDEYGMDKTLFAKETITAIKDSCGEEFVVGIRLGAFEPTLSDGLLHAKELSGYADFLNMSYGGDCDPEKPEDFPCSAAVYGAMKVKELLPTMPVFAVDQIDSKEAVNEALKTGIDMVNIGRSALIDPSFANHVLCGEKEGKCLHCKSDCKWNPDTMKNTSYICPGEVLFHRA